MFLIKSVFDTKTTDVSDINVKKICMFVCVCIVIYFGLGCLFRYTIRIHLILSF